ncbi:hypothetical protein DEAC_c36010 [Desulfosporosinus acididurans]|uniref:Uncharacterized protein n=1 Tax=Desulfosporosinus acididurans TaxID=476652 RepID=A0A0J1FLJ1_9FIRM|nr:hypothetical protein [Desulfosporosinus acididurans]KLU64399.1 hypothetical protein DEAC_c36010 [Desulfosporosinus acididurans]
MDGNALGIKGLVLQIVHYVCSNNMQQALMSVKGQRIQLLMSTSPPAGRPPNITGIVKEVDGGLLKLELSRGEATAKPKIGVYSIRSILGFVPVSAEEDGEDGCGQCKKKI